MRLVVIDCGQSDYRKLWELQKSVWNARTTGVMPDVLLLTEHQPVYSIGKTADPNHLVASGSFLEKHRIDVVQTDRGGGITFHGPGQLVVYPIISLEPHGRDIHRYIRMLEKAIIDLLGTYGVDGVQDPEYTGVWVGENKIASIGIKVARWVTMHGAAINISTDLAFFDGIIACGIFHKGIISLSALLGREITVQDAGKRLVPAFADQFGSDVEFMTVETVLSLLQMETEMK